jgi:hypothetical protein
MGLVEFNAGATSLVLQMQYQVNAKFLTPLMVKVKERGA